MSPSPVDDVPHRSYPGFVGIIVRPLEGVNSADQRWHATHRPDIASVVARGEQRGTMRSCSPMPMGECYHVMGSIICYGERCTGPARRVQAFGRRRSPRTLFGTRQRCISYRLEVISPCLPCGAATRALRRRTSILETDL